MRKSLLVVDDCPVLLSSLARRLRLAGYRVYTARTGAAALRRAAQRMPDLILLDVMLPDMNGYSVCEALQHHSATVTIPVILVTALTEALPRYAGLSSGAKDFIHKPFVWPELLERIRNTLACAAPRHD